MPWQVSLFCRREDTREIRYGKELNQRVGSQLECRRGTRRGLNPNEKTKGFTGKKTWESCAKPFHGIREKTRAGLAFTGPSPRTPGLKGAVFLHFDQFVLPPGVCASERALLPATWFAFGLNSKK